MSKSTWIKIKNQKLDFSRFKKKKIRLFETFSLYNL